MKDFTPHTARAFITKLHHLCHMFRKLPVPSIAIIDGACLGGGLEVAACCDLRIATPESIFAMPEVRLGIPSVIEAAVLPSLIGWGHTRDLLYTGRVIKGQEALQMGLVNKLADANQLESETQPWIDDILAGDPAAIRAQKHLIEYWLEHGLEAGIAESIDTFTNSFSTDAPGRLFQDFLSKGKSGR